MRSLPSLWLIPLGIALFALPPQRAAADAATDKAAAHNEAAKKAFNLGKLDQAIASYEKAYEAKPLPVFLFNLAQCYMRGTQTSARLRRAVHYFESFLHNQPDAPNAAAVKKKMAELRAKAETLEIAEKKAAAEAAAKKAAAAAAARKAAAASQPTSHPATTIIVTPKPDQPKPVAGTPFYKRWWFWTIVGAAVVGGGVAIGVAAGQPDSRIPTGADVQWSSFNLGTRP